MWNKLSYLGPLHNDSYDLLYIWCQHLAQDYKQWGGGRGQWTVEGLYKHNIAI